MIWHLMDDGVLGGEVKNTDFYLKLKEVKDRYPKEIVEEKEEEDEIHTVEEQDS